MIAGLRTLYPAVANSSASIRPYNAVSCIANDATLHLRPELLRAEQHETEVATTFGNVEQHFANICVVPVGRCVLVEFIDEDDDVIDSEAASFEMFAQFRHNAGKDKVLRIFINAGDVR